FNKKGIRQHSYGSITKFKDNEDCRLSNRVIPPGFIVKDKGVLKSLPIRYSFKPVPCFGFEKRGKGLDKSQICSNFHPTITDNKNERCTRIQKLSQKKLVSISAGEYNSIQRKVDDQAFNVGGHVTTNINSMGLHKDNTRSYLILHSYSTMLEVSTISKTNKEYSVVHQKLISHADKNLKQDSHVMDDEDNLMCIKFINPTLKSDGTYAKDQFGTIGTIDILVLMSLGAIVPCKKT
ncbi:unnamed protein product, partial [Dovyalis caffra]